MRRLFAGFMVVLFVACGGEDERAPKAPFGEGNGGRTTISNGGRNSGDAGAAGNGSGGSRGGATGAAGEAGAGGDAGGPGGAGTGTPVVAITSPAAVTDPDEGEVLVEETVTVTCSAQRSDDAGSLPVRESSVKIEQLDARGRVVREVNGVPAGGGEYQAGFALGQVEAGVVRFRCRAEDMGAPPKSGSAEISTFVDRGPQITVTSPLPDLPQPLNGAVEFEFSVVPDPLTTGDTEAAVDEVTLTVDGLPITTLAPAPRRPNVYVASVDFNDRTLFPQTPSGEIQVVITASNERSPEPAIRTERYLFILDGDGPTIVVTSPKPNDIIGRRRALEFTVTDTVSGVDEESLVVRINGEEFIHQPPPSPIWTVKDGKVTFILDSTKIKGSQVQATINIRARDLAGNESEGDTLIVNLDQQPPIVSLDPGNVRLLTTSGTNISCSESFDPLGDAAPNDGTTVPPVATIRLLVWDETNTAPGLTIQYLAGAKTDSAYVYLQPDVDRPLLIDTDGDDVCDKLDTIGADRQPLHSIHLDPVAAGGNAKHLTDDRLTKEPLILPDVCSFTSGPSPTLCAAQASEMNYVIKHTVANQTELVVYGLHPKPGDLQCTGGQWEILSLVGHTGWVCLAGEATDKADNHGISRPLRVCVDDDDDPSTTPCDLSDMPECTDGCSLPKDFPAQHIQYK